MINILFSKIKKIISILIHGWIKSYSQIFFSNSVFFASVICLCTFIDPVSGLCGGLTVFVCNGLAIMLAYDSKTIRSGTYSVNALLIGLGLGLSFELNMALIIFIILAGILSFIFSVWILARFSAWGLPMLSIPFLIVSWILILAGKEYNELLTSERGIFMANTLWNIGGESLYKIFEFLSTFNINTFWETYFKSMGAILFEYNLLAGFLISISLFFFSRISFLLSLLGFASGWFFYKFLGGDIRELSYSYIGFNFILTAIGLGGTFLIPSISSFLLILIITPINALITTASLKFLGVFSLPVLALPFNIIVLLVLYTLKIRTTTKFLPAVHVQYFSPEKNLYHYHNWIERFSKSSGFQLHLPFFGEWVVTQGHHGKITHKEQWKYAWDFEVKDEHNKFYKSNGTDTEDYYCFNLPILSPANGTVEDIYTNVEDNLLGDVNLNSNWGNSVIIKHLEGLYSKFSHLKNNSITVKKGDYVFKGQRIANCGNSGRSPQPHLHFQLQVTPFIGSHTLKYPICYFMENKSGKYEFNSYNYPQENAVVSPILKNELLNKSFTFIHGSNLFVEFTERNKTSSLIWEIKTDMLNRTFIYCNKTNSVAYFYNDGTVFYFLEFEGDKKSLLYYFYLGANRILLAFYPGVQIKDFIPLTAFNSLSFFWLEDVITPFYSFKKSVFMAECSETSETLQPQGIQLNTSATVLFRDKMLKQLNFSFVIDSEGIKEFKVLKNKIEIIKTSIKVSE